MAGLNLPTYLKGENDPPALPKKEDNPKDEKGGEKKSHKLKSLLPGWGIYATPLSP